LEYPSSDGRSEEEAPLSVSELVGLVTETLESEYAEILVVGELTSFKRAASGHCYLTLSDEAASIDAAMFRGQAIRLTFEPSVGDEVVVRGKISVYAKQGRMQLYVMSMRPVGAGAAQRALEELKRRLAAEGLFAPERKRPLPFLPATIGVVTSRSGAALHDILTTLRRRYRHCHVVLSSAAVQGADAPRELVAALGALARFGRCDVVIIGRGGGASEDLAAFNDEALVRAVAAFPVPIVSAVGHEVDYSLCDLAADVRAATPTAAAETVVPVYADLVEETTSLERRLRTAAVRYVDHLRHRVGSVRGRLRDPARLVAGHRQRVDELGMRLERALVGQHRTARVRYDDLRARTQDLGRQYVGDLRDAVRTLDLRMERAVADRARRAGTGLAELASKLDALSPLAVLERGYSLATRPDGRLVRSASDTAVGQTLDLRFHRGSAQALVVATNAAEVRRGGGE